MTEQVIRAALVIGGTGLVGQALLKQLQQDAACQRITVLCRKTPQDLSFLQNSEKVEWVEFDTLAVLETLDLGQFSHAFSCLGTTRKKAGSKHAFYAIDYGLNFEFARRVHAYIPHFSIVSALGANAKSYIYYNQVKGELEQALIRLGFKRLTIVQPSLLLGARAETRYLEQLSQRILTPVLAYLPKQMRSRPIYAEQVAYALVALTRLQTESVKIYDNLALLNITHAQ